MYLHIAFINYNSREDMQVTAESNYADMEEETNEIVYDTIVHGGKGSTTVNFLHLSYYFCNRRKMSLHPRDHFA